MLKLSPCRKITLLTFKTSWCVKFAFGNLCVLRVCRVKINSQTSSSQCVSLLRNVSNCYTTWPETRALRETRRHLTPQDTRRSNNRRLFVPRTGRRSDNRCAFREIWLIRFTARTFRWDSPRTFRWDSPHYRAIWHEILHGSRFAAAVMASLLARRLQEPRVKSVL